MKINAERRFKNFPSSNIPKAENYNPMDLGSLGQDDEDYSDEDYSDEEAPPAPDEEEAPPAPDEEEAPPEPDEEAPSDTTEEATTSSAGGIWGTGITASDLTSAGKFALSTGKQTMQTYNAIQKATSQKAQSSSQPAAIQAPSAASPSSNISSLLTSKNSIYLIVAIAAIGAVLVLRKK